ncbi:unnamed protein product [Rotaria sp. Silwood2]|nr:unnamed protein product [Rotaria sp. Silwood2]CAF4326897.1 unnamed protein product [Rotaria sp. Silwood2]
MKYHKEPTPMDVNNYPMSYNTHDSTESDDKDLLDPILKKLHKGDLIDRLLGCAYGQALSDAYGLSTEFEDRITVATMYPDNTQIIPFQDYILTAHSSRWTRGDWTDDTDQWILILETLTYPNGDDIMFAKKLRHWIYQCFSELGDCRGMGLGANVSQVTSSYNFLSDPHEASRTTWERSYRQAAPNGAVIRCSASALVHFRDIEKVKSTAISMCKVTHFDPRCVASCLAVCLASTYLLQASTEDDIEILIDRVQKETIYILDDQLTSEHKEEFLWYTHKDRTLEELNLDEPRSIG